MKPPKPDAPEATTQEFRFRLTFQLITGLVVLIVLTLAVSVSVIWFRGRPLLETVGYQTQQKLGENLALALSQEMAVIEGIARSLAVTAVASPREDPAIQRLVPSLLNQLGKDSVIAGGGIWPEPYAFDPKAIRHSFFWGRNPGGLLEFYDDYNNPEGPGYHNEEWYVPARLLAPGEVYWSKSYTDPYSLQPMVTCTAPMFDRGTFIGVATVDLKLDRVSTILDKLVDSSDVYAFVVDRNNKFIAYPYPDRVITQRHAEEGSKPDFIYASELADFQPSFTVFARSLESIEEQIFARYSARSADAGIDVSLLNDGSYQISSHEARRISAHLWQQHQKPSNFPREVGRIEVPRDSILVDEALAIVYQMPVTNWKVVTVFRRSLYQSLSDTVSRELMLYISLATLLFGGVAYLLLRARILKPVRAMVDQLSIAVADPDRERVQLKYDKADELGLLAFWINLRSSQLEIARDQAEQANRAKTEFLAKMSHELRTPLNSIIGFSRRLMVKLRGEIDEFYYQALQRIHHNGDNLLELISDILDLATIEAGEQQLRREWQSVNNLLTDVEIENRLEARDRSLEFRVVKLQQDVELFCDRYKVLQILNNLVANALKATHRGSVQVCVFRDVEKPGFLAFEVSDTGCGISESDQKKLFKQFSQLDDRLGAERGTGLGLYLVEQLLKMHGGSVQLKSAPGTGSVFTCYLPTGARLTTTETEVEETLAR